MFYKMNVSKFPPREAIKPFGEDGSERQETVADGSFNGRSVIADNCIRTVEPDELTSSSGAAVIGTRRDSLTVLNQNPIEIPGCAVDPSAISEKRDSQKNRRFQTGRGKTPSTSIQVTAEETKKPSKGKIKRLRASVINSLNFNLAGSGQPVSGVGKMIKGVTDEAFSLALQLAGKQDNNADYYDKLSLFELPDSFHSRGFEAQLEKYRNLQVDDGILDIIHFAAIDFSSRLEKEFGMFYAPSSKWMTPLVEELRKRNCHTGIEAMAGNGSLSYFLTKNYGLAMTASDNHSTHQECQRQSSYRPPFAVVAEDSAHTVKSNPNADFLLISWPTNYTSTPYADIRDPMYFDDYKIIQAWGNKRPVVFIGERPTDSEGVTGATGSPHFHKYLNYYFDPIEITEYQGKHLNSRDKLVLFVPNGRHMEATEETSREDDLREMMNQCPIS